MECLRFYVLILSGRHVAWKRENKDNVFERRIFELGRQNKRDFICSNFYCDFTQFIRGYI
jgi:hypothetical protein